jgi:hypothetical protein
MSAKTVIAFLVGAVAASTGTAAAITQGHVFQLQDGDHASYGKILCSALYVPPYSGFDCVGARRYEVIYAPSEVRVLHLNGTHGFKSVFAVNPAGR